jgi:hypothetical protein
LIIHWYKVPKYMTPRDNQLEEQVKTIVTSE